MTKEEKDLLSKDICARLPHHVKVEITYSKENGSSLRQKICKEGVNELNSSIFWLYEKNEINIKPYLFPMSSMTEEQKEDLLMTIVGKEGLKIFSVTKNGIISNDKTEQSFENFSIYNINFSNENIEVYIDWFNKNHFDYRGLIEKGLAIDCTNLNIY
jgi:hypothetical protein